MGPFQNVTVLEGSTARLQCRVISDTPVYLQWLRRLERLPPYHPVADTRPDANGVLQVLPSSRNIRFVSPLPFSSPLRSFSLAGDTFDASSERASSVKRPARIPPRRGRLRVTLVRFVNIDGVSATSIKGV